MRNIACADVRRYIYNQPMLTLIVRRLDTIGDVQTLKTWLLYAAYLRGEVYSHTGTNRERADSRYSLAACVCMYRGRV